MKILATLLCLKIVIPLVVSQVGIISQLLYNQSISVSSSSYDEISAISIEEFASMFSNTDINTTKHEEVETVQVNTVLGTIFGKKVVTEEGMEMNVFLGIPYAQPPVDRLRFQTPRPVYGYKDYEAFTFGNSCPQPNQEVAGSYEGNEDCLNLNVFSKVTNNTSLKPVMIWIHGGGFVYGSAPPYDPTSLVKEDVIVVTINYRLGALGFLNFGNDLAPGNLAIRDQIQSLRWVKMMVWYFGGDPNRITIFGESAGGFSCHAITMSPKAYGLISGAIYESGTMLYSKEDITRSTPNLEALKMANNVNCSSSSFDTEMLECLQNLPLQEILDLTAENTFYQPNIDSYSTDPVLPIDYLTAMKNGHFNKIPIMTGTVLNDGGLVFPEDNFEETWKVANVEFLGLKGGDEVTEEEKLDARIIGKYYLGNNYNLSEVLQDWTNMITDAYFLSPDQKLAELASQYVPVYNFRFVYPGSSSFLAFYTMGRENGTISKEQWSSLKPVHSDEMFYLFDFMKLNDEEQELKDIMTKYWTNFAKYGHPSPLLADNITQWLPYSTEKNIMILGKHPDLESDGAVMLKNIEEERMVFWNKVHWNERESKIEEASIFYHAYSYVLRLFRGY